MKTHIGLRVFFFFALVIVNPVCASGDGDPDSSEQMLDYVDKASEEVLWAKSDPVFDEAMLDDMRFDWRTGVPGDAPTVYPTIPANATAAELELRTFAGKQIRTFIASRQRAIERAQQEIMTLVRRLANDNKQFGSTPVTLLLAHRVSRDAFFNALHAELFRLGADLGILAHVIQQDVRHDMSLFDNYLLRTQLVSAFAVSRDQRIHLLQELLQKK